MANIEDAATCGTCGRPLPPQQGRGRERRYCDATCRSAARRKRARTTASRKATLDTTATRAAPASPGTTAPSATLDSTPAPGSSPVPGAELAVGLLDAARGFVAELPPAGHRSPLAAVNAARELARSVDAALHHTVDAARAAGHTWQEIGEVLGTTRQAAFQRFGRPIDPRTGAAMAAAIRPDATERGVTLLVNLVEGNYAAVRADFDATMNDAVRTDAAVAATWAQMAGLVGEYERMGEPFTHQLGDYTAVDVPLEFEAGSMTARVSYDANGKVAGLRFLPRTAD
jgi:hypothetical protein